MPKVLTTDKFYTKIVNDNYELYCVEDISPQSRCMHAFDLPAGIKTLILKFFCKFTSLGQSINTLAYFTI